jgi:hypothetical protein
MIICSCNAFSDHQVWSTFAKATRRPRMRQIYDYLGAPPSAVGAPVASGRSWKRQTRYLNEVRFTPWLSLWRSSREILNHGCKSLRSDFHRAGERMIDGHNGQQPGKDQD